MKKHLQATALLLLFFTLFSCNNQPKKANVEIKENLSVSKISSVTNQLLKAGNDNPFEITLSPESNKFYLPALQSFAGTSYNGLWIMIGGQVEGFHGTSNNPAPFKKSVANDSIWVVDVENAKSYGVPVPKQYLNSLAVSNPQSYRDGNNFYLCGGYTVSDPSQKNFNTTSNSFFKINIPSLIQFVKSGGTTPALNQVFPIAIKNNFVRVTGGELFVENDNFYLIGGQDYEGNYSDGLNGKYTNSIRSFKLLPNGKGWFITNTNSLVDSVNLHRRDFNLVPYVTSNGSLDAILFGGVFTRNGLSYNSPVYISGLSSGKPTISVGTTQQKCNQYTSAIVPMYVSSGEAMMYGLLGGISYMKYDTKKGGLVIGDNGMAMPFSNLVDFIISNGNASIEYVQTPPHALLPGYLGSNASFFPVPQLTVGGHDNILDLNKIFVGAPTDVKIGYMYGGILSNGPTSGTTPEGHVNTYANPVLYAVHISFDLSKTQKTQQK